jgi:uncharacterized SAM-binding protein YcdF (DUF218 family)
MTDITREHHLHSDGAVGPFSAADRGRMPGRPRFTKVLLGLMALALLALGAGFAAFANSVANAVPPSDPRADGIVVLTGGAARLDEALQLLADGHGERLLISGVNPRVKRNTLAATIGGDLTAVFACCTDLDHRALDTIGNAAEAARWADAQDFSSLIVVTSAYHMPRSMVELSGAMPGVRLVPYPVRNPDLHLADWWRDRAAFSLLAREYGKFLAAEARQALIPDRPASR